MLLEQLIRNAKRCSLIAVSPVFDEEFIHRAVCERQVIAIYLRDTAEHIFDRLVFSDEHDARYANDEDKNKHIILRISGKISWRWVKHAAIFPGNMRWMAETIAEDLSMQIRERIQQEIVSRKWMSCSWLWTD